MNMTGMEGTPQSPAADATSSPEKTKKQHEHLMKKLNLVAGETITPDAVFRPAPLSFTSRYLVPVGVLIVHLLFWWFDNFEATSDSAAAIEIIGGFFGFGVSSFVLAMLLLTWFNRFMNTSTSGKVYTFTLLIITVIPGLYFLDGLLAGNETVLPALLSWAEIDAYETKMLPMDWNPLLFGIIWFILLVIVVEYNRRSYTYGVSDKAIIMKRDFMMSRNQRRVLYDNITDINLEQGFFGTIFSFGNVVPVTGSGFGLDDGSSNVAEAAAASTAVDAISGEEKKQNIAIRFLKFFVIIALLQRTRRGLTRDPDHCLFGVKAPQNVYDIISKYQLEHDPAQKMQELKETMQNMVQQQP